MEGEAREKESRALSQEYASQTLIERQVYTRASVMTQPCPTLCNPIDCGLLGSSVRGILQARILESVAIPFSREPFQPRNRTQADSVPSETPGKPICCYTRASNMDTGSNRFRQTDAHTWGLGLR